MGTYELIEHIEVGSGGATEIEFTAISGAYTDLKLVLSARSTKASTTDNVALTFNSSSANYSSRLLYQENAGTPASATGGTSNITFLYASGATATANTFGSTEISIPQYSGSNAKSVSIDTVTENNSTSTIMGITAGLWNDSTAISSIKLDPVSGDFPQYSSASLFGIRKHNTASAPKATGGIITYDAVNNKWVHTFTASGTFTPTENLTAEYLVIAGGGSGSGSGTAGGGGAGGYRSSVTGELTGGGGSAESPLSLTASTGYTVTVGAGGAGVSNVPESSGIKGNDSVFASITAEGGGYGAHAANGGPGGSGGGGGGNGNYTGGIAVSPTQGYAGGNGIVGSGGNRPSGGGGGAGEVGENGVTGNSGDGGDGLSSSITGTSITRAGGGGGAIGTSGTSAGIGGAGGGGNGQKEGGAQQVTSGAVNTGSGGGGATGTTSGAGGSGIVIVRYAA